MAVQTIGLLGAGTMGAGIGQVAAAANYSVVLFDISPNALEKAQSSIRKNLGGAVERGKMSEDQAQEAFDRVHFTGEVSDVTADLVIEAIVENLEVKQELLSKVAAANTAETIIASNTSTIPITQIAEGVPHPERVAGMHFFNPAHIMKLVEVIAGEKTSPEVINTLKHVSRKMGKTPAVAKDSPGFIVNRVARPFYVEALKIVEDNVADHESIDQLLESAGFRMGPFRLMDLIGVDANNNVTKTLYSALPYERFKPSQLQQNMVDEGLHGRKSGRGFYEYEH